MIAIVSRLTLLKPPKESDLDEKPPVAIVDIAWTKESKEERPINQYEIPQIADKAIYKTVISVAILAALGRIFSEVSELSNLNNCIPPTPRLGRIEIALTIIPIPPSHWSMALHNSIDLGASSKLDIIVDPVVVIPDILSKNESVIESSKEEKINGNEPNIAILNQERAVNKKACCRFSFLSWLRLDKKNKTPNMIEIIDPPINEESISE